MSKGKGFDYEEAAYNFDKMALLAEDPEKSLKEIDEMLKAFKDPILHLVKLYLLLLEGKVVLALQNFQENLDVIASRLDVLREYLILAYQMGCRETCDSLLERIEGYMIANRNAAAGIWLGETLVFIAFNMVGEERKKYAKWAIDVLEEALRLAKTPARKEKVRALLRLARRIRKENLLPTSGMTYRMILNYEGFFDELKRKYGEAEKPDNELAEELFLASKFYTKEKCKTCPRPDEIKDLCWRGLMPCVYEPVFPLFVRVEKKKGEIKIPEWALEKSRVLAAVRDSS